MPDQAIAPLPETTLDPNDETVCLAHIPLKVLCDVLKDNSVEVISLPENNDPVFAWFEAHYGTSSCPEPCSTTSILQHANEAQCIAYLTENPEGYALLYGEFAALPESLLPFREHVLCVRKEPLAAYDLTEDLTRVFLHSMGLENRLRGMVNSKAPLASVLNTGATMLMGYLCVVDTSYNTVLACTNTLPPTAEYTGILAKHLRYEPTFALQKRTTLSNASKPSLRKTETEEYLFLQYPLNSSSAFIGHLTYVQRKEDCAAFVGIEAAFLRFAQYARALFSHLTDENLALNLERHSFLVTLLRDICVPDDILAANTRYLQIPAHAHFRLIVLDMNDCTGCNKNNLLNAMRNINKGKNCVVQVDRNLVCINYYLPGDQHALSIRKVTRDLELYVVKPFGAICGISTLFDGIGNIYQGYRQALYALQNRNLVIREATMYSKTMMRSGVPFETALSYFLCSAAIRKSIEEHAEMLEFYVTHTVTIPNKLAEEDVEKGTSTFALLWNYIAFEGSVVRASRQMYMHRNTFLYHIKQIEERFDFDLGDPLLREQLKLEYRCVFSRLSDDEYHTLFCREET